MIALLRRPAVDKQEKVTERMIRRQAKICDGVEFDLENKESKFVYSRLVSYILPPNSQPYLDFEAPGAAHNETYSEMRGVLRHLARRCHGFAAVFPG